MPIVGRTIAFVALFPVVTLAACTSSHPPSVAQPADTATLTSPTPASATCALTTSRDIIVRDVTPRLPPAAQVLGDVDYAKCRPSVETLPEEAPTGPGYCTQIAWASDNPGYNADATPAAPLKKVIVEVGPGC